MKRPSLIVLAAYAVAAAVMLEFCTRLVLLRSRVAPEGWEYVKGVGTMFMGFPGFGVPGFAWSPTAEAVKGMVLWGLTLAPAACSGHKWGRRLAPVALLLYAWSYVWVLFGLMVASAM